MLPPQTKLLLSPSCSRYPFRKVVCKLSWLIGDLIRRKALGFLNITAILAKHRMEGNFFFPFQAWCTASNTVCKMILDPRNRKQLLLHTFFQPEETLKCTSSVAILHRAVTTVNKTNGNISTAESIKPLDRSNTMTSNCSSTTKKVFYLVT